MHSHAEHNNNCKNKKNIPNRSVFDKNFVDKLSTQPLQDYYLQYDREKQTTDNFASYGDVRTILFPIWKNIRTFAKSKIK